MVNIYDQGRWGPLAYRGCKFSLDKGICVLNIINCTSCLIPMLSTRVTRNRWKAREAETGGHCQYVKKSHASTQCGDTSVDRSACLCLQSREEASVLWKAARYFISWSQRSFNKTLCKSLASSLVHFHCSSLWIRTG